MFSSYSSSSHERLWSLGNRRLLMHNDTTSTTDSTPQSKTTSNNGFDANVVMLLAVLLCAIICSLAINFIVRCAFGCSIFSSRDPNQTESENGNHRVTATRLANRGVKKAALKTFPIVSYKAELNIPGLDTECVICLSEFVAGERVRLLPKCNHGFHARCIDKWLRAHSSCPTCRHCLIETCQKIVGCTLTTSSHETIVITMASLAPEDMIRN